MAGWRPFEDAILLGDSGYSNLGWLLTPNVPADLPVNGQDRYLRRHRSTRQLIECTIGILKSKFPCLNHLRLQTPEKCCKVILACITLHNIEIAMKNDMDLESVATRFPTQQNIQNFHTGDDVLSQIVAEFEAETESTVIAEQEP